MDFISRVAGTEELDRAAGDGTQAEVDSLLDRSTTALAQFQKLQPEVQELAEIRFLDECESALFSVRGYSIQPLNPRLPIFAHPDRLEVISVFAGSPTPIQPNQSLDFLSRDSSKGRLRLRALNKKHLPFFYAYSWSLSDLLRARELVLEGKYLCP